MIERLQEIMRGGSSTQQLAMFAGAVLLVLVVDWQYVYGPKAATLAQEKAEVETLRTEYNAKRAKSNAREDFAKDKLPLMRKMRDKKEHDAVVRYVLELRKAGESKIKINQRFVEEPKDGTETQDG